MMKLGLLVPFALVASSLFVAGCAVDATNNDDAADDDESSVVDESAALTGGANGSACLQSPYNCKLRASGGNRIADGSGNEEWAVSAYDVLDGDGQLMALGDAGNLKFNYGQARVLNGTLHLLAMSTSNGSAGWVALDYAAKKDALDGLVGRVKGEDPGEGKMACYEIRDADPAESLVEKKVVRDTKSSHERAGDYLPLVRKDGVRYMNLAYNVPGLALGGPSVDIFQAGTKFQRVQVPTASGKPHLSVKLYVKAGNGHYTKPAGTMAFYYGYVPAADGTKRFGWMAASGLTPSNGCK